MPERLIMILLVSDDLLQDRHALLIAKIAKLLAISSNVAALVQLQPPQLQLIAADASRQ